MGRKDRWKEPKHLVTFYAGDDEDRLELLGSWQTQAPDIEDTGLTNFGIIEACKELIFDVVDCVPVFYAIMYGFDVDHGSVKLEHTLDILVDGDQSDAEIEEDVANTLALASAADVPVYPNTQDVAATLARYHRSMLINGFTAPDGEGNRVRLMLNRSPGERIDDPHYISEVDATESYSPAEIALIKESVARELDRLSNAQAMLDALSTGIAELSGLLDAVSRNEHALQRCLTTNPILFGTEYIKVIPKHRLGSEFEMDYALQRASGIVDLVEIESSTLKLFTKDGKPSADLVHAEQQVIDWIAWIERNHYYAEKKLPGLYSPVGFVVIGRTPGLPDAFLEKLHRRNQMFKGQIRILTYDDLLDRARCLLEQLEGISNDR